MDRQILMTSRYGVEMTTVIKCGQGLHQADVEAAAGPEMITLFRKVSSTSSDETIMATP